MKKIINVMILMFLASSSYGQIIINEVLYDPSNSALDGDANGDGVYSQTEDEFIEFINTGAFDFDMSGYQIWDDTISGQLRYTIPSGTLVPPSGALVVFGGGVPTGSFGGAVVLTASVSANGLSLNNSGEIITLKNSLGQFVTNFDSDALSDNPNESYTRNPDITGAFEQHSANTAMLFSPGTRSSGIAFNTVFVSPPHVLATTPMIINEVLYDPSNSGLDGDANADGVYGQEEDSFIEFINTDTANYDMSGYQIWDDTVSGALRYTIPSGTIVPAGGALVVFGGGIPTGTFGGAIVLTADTGTTGLSLGNSGEIIVVRNALGQPVLSFDSDALSNNPNESYTRNPDITGGFEQHADNTPLLFSPGTKIDGTDFPNAATNQFITSVTKIGNPKTYRAFFTLPAASTYRLQIRTQNDPVWKTSNTWSNASLTQQNFQALEFNATNSLRIGYEVGGTWTYGNSFDFVSDCKPMTVSAVELLAPFCAGDSAILKTITNGGFRVKSFLWNTGETTRFIYGQQGQTYSVVVTDESGCTQSASVTVSSVNTQYTPVNFAVAKPNAVTFTGSWSPATLGSGVSLVGYRMAYRQVGVGAAWTNTALSTNTTATVNFTGSGLPSANYEFTVFARVNDNGSIYNTEYACRERRFYNGLGNKTEVDSLSSVNSWFVYPNPTSEFIIIDPKEDGQWRIFSAAGKLILSGESKPTEEQKILVTQWSVGVYLLEWQSETNLETKHFIIQ